MSHDPFIGITPCLRRRASTGAGPFPDFHVRGDDGKAHASAPLSAASAWVHTASLALAAIFLLACISTAEPQSGSPVSVESHVDKTSITIGDTVRYTVRLRRDENAQVRWPSLGANLGVFEIRDYRKAEPRAEKGGIVEEISYTVSTFDTGRFVIPPLAINYLVPPDSTWRALNTESLQIYVRSILPSEAGDIRDVKAPWALPRDWRRVILIAAIAGAVILLAVFGYLWWRKRQGKSLLPQRLEPSRPAHELAQEELRQLRESDLLARGEIKLFYSLLSEIMRRYFEGRYAFMALEMTTAELIRELRKLEPTENACADMQELLEICDLVKFAKHVPAADEAGRLLDLAEAFVEKTRPVVIIADKQNGKATGANVEPESTPPASTEEAEKIASQ